MSAVLPWESDIFISYAHIDDEALTQDSQGWVSNFHYALQVRLRQLLGEDAKIWRDPKLNGNDIFGDELVGKVRKVALLVSILSPRYTKSEWCQREVQEFCKAAEKNLGLRIGNRSRIFKVVKTPVFLEEQASVMQGMLGYEFYEVDSATQRPREFGQDAGAARDPRYWDKLEDVAYELAELLTQVKQLNGSDAMPTATSSSRIYLAHTTSDLKAEYDSIKREFQMRGHGVLPDQMLPQNGPELREAVRGYLQECAISVHLLGKNYGLIPEAADRSIVELQNELAVERCQDPGFSRVIWLPRDLEPQDGRQRSFVERVETDPEAQKGADVLRTDLGELKITIENLLAGPKVKAQGPAFDVPFQICTVYAEEDFEEAAAVEDALYEAGLEVISPLFEGDEAEVAADRRENLLRGDGVLIYRAKAGESWFRSALREMDDIERQRSTPFRAKGVFLAGAESPQKSRFQTRRGILMKRFAGFSAGDLQPFMTALGQSSEGDQ